jgi:hypothetical protein
VQISVYSVASIDLYDAAIFYRTRSKVSGVLCVVVSWIFSLRYSMASGRYVSQLTLDNHRGKNVGGLPKTRIMQEDNSYLFLDTALLIHIAHYM